MDFFSFLPLDILFLIGSVAAGILVFFLLRLWVRCEAEEIAEEKTKPLYQEIARLEREYRKKLDCCYAYTRFVVEVELEKHEAKKHKKKQA